MKLAKCAYFAAVAIACLATSALAQNTLDDVMKTNKIAIAIPTDFPPCGFVGTDLKPQGLDIDMAHYIAAKLGVAIELAPVTSANRIPYLQTKKADLVISTLGDEITSALDPELVGEVLKVVESLAQDGMTLLLVTHEMSFARRVANRVIFMHQGRVHEMGAPATLFGSPQTPELRQFLSTLTD